MSTDTSRSRAQLVVGLILISLGFVFLYDRAFLYHAVARIGRLFGVWWPSFYIALGLAWLILGRPRHKFFPLLLVFGGAFVQIGRLEIWPWWTAHNMWPLILIGMGLWMLACRLFPGTTPQVGNEESKREYSEESVDAFVLLGGIERAATSKSFRGGEVTAILGGIDIDLTRAQLAPGEHRLKCFAVLGGVEVTVPSTMNVVVTGTPILGAISDERAPSAPKEVTAADLAVAPPAPPARLLVDGFAMFGGIEVKT